MMLYDLDSELIIAKMSRALNGADLASPDARAAAYIAANVSPREMLQFDKEAVRVQQVKRRGEQQP